MKIVFMGTPEFALEALKKLAAEHEVLAVYTKEPKVSGRGNKLVKTPVHLWAEEQGIEVRTPKTLRHAEEQEKFAALNADIAIVAAYGLILPPPILEAFPLGCVNIHGSLLPRWRGAAPIQRAIEAGDEKSGITTMKMDAGLDTGEMLRFDAEAYLTSHAERDLPEPAVSEEDARAMAGEGLTVQSEKLAVIPTSGAEEIYCRELICETEDGRHYLLYVNAMTGAQEKILILLEDESGTLAL